MNRFAMAAFLLLCAAAGGAGCSYTKVGRGDFATEVTPYGKMPIALTAAVSTFKNETGDDDVTQDTMIAFSRGYLNVLEKTQIFKNVYTDVEAPEADVRFEGTLRNCEIYENNWWLASWVVLGVATFGLFPGIGALFGLPYGTENGEIELSVRALDKTGAVVATYETDWDTTLVYNIYNTSSTRARSIYERPNRAVSAAVGASIAKVVADEGRYARIAAAKAPSAPSQPQQPPPGEAPTSAPTATAPPSTGPPPR